VIDMTGLWAVCGAGRIGLIQREGHRGGAACWFGVGLDGRAWQSICPQILNPTDQAILNER